MFLYCRYHGCKKCCHAETVHPLRGIRMGQIFEETVQRQRDLEQAGYSVVTIWEHEYDDKLKHDVDFKQFCKDFFVMEPMNPRAAFYGGRTNAVKLHHKVAGDEKIRYYDVCRLVRAFYALEFFAVFFRYNMYANPMLLLVANIHTSTRTRRIQSATQWLSSPISRIPRTTSALCIANFFLPRT